VHVLVSINYSTLRSLA